MPARWHVWSSYTLFGHGHFNSLNGWHRHARVDGGIAFLRCAFLRGHARARIHMLVKSRVMHGCQLAAHARPSRRSAASGPLGCTHVRHGTHSWIGIWATKSPLNKTAFWSHGLRMQICVPHVQTGSKKSKMGPNGGIYSAAVGARSVRLVHAGIALRESFRHRATRVS